MRWATVLASMLVVAAAVPCQPPGLTHGPIRGHSDTSTIHVWARAAAAGDFTLHLQNLTNDALATAHATADPNHDMALHFSFAELTAGTAYDYWITSGDHIVHAPGGAPLQTAMADTASDATIAFGSCANDEKFAEQPIWGRILARSPHGLVLLGDTPYIDSGTIEVRRRRYREFLGFDAIHATLKSIPTWTTWDDHDYATNDRFGSTAGSETARSVFIDFHAHGSYGDGKRGIYTRFRRGPIEVFVLDTRTFADTEDSVLEPGERTLLGRTQIEWLQRGLKTSTATFRVLACGMVWNGGVRPNKLDCWGNWLPERDALFRWIGEAGIAGVALVSGDVHRSRMILHPTQDLAGYDIPEFVTSPMAGDPIATNNGPVPGLEFDAEEGHSCLLLTATAGKRGSLRAVYLAGDGREFHRRDLAISDLSR